MKATVCDNCGAVQMKLNERKTKSPDTVPVRLDRHTLILVRREKYEQLGEEECIRQFTERRKPSAGDIASMYEML
jgi:hypothetical protein